MGRSSLEEALRAVHESQVRAEQREVSARVNSNRAMCPREAAAQAAISRQRATQHLINDIMSSVRPELDQHGNREGQASVDVRLTCNLSNIQTTMEEIQSAVTSARATLEESMSNNVASPQMRNNNGNGSSDGSSSTQQASPDSGAFEAAHRPSVQSGDESNDDDRIYEQVSDGEVEQQTPSSQVSLGQVAPENLEQHPMSGMSLGVTSNGHVRGDESPLYHVYDSSNSAAPYHTINPSPVDQRAHLNYTSDSSDDPHSASRNPDDTYDGPYYSCDCGEDSMSCSCSECNSIDDDDTDEGAGPAYATASRQVAGTSFGPKLVAGKSSCYAVIASINDATVSLSERTPR